MSTRLRTRGRHVGALLLEAQRRFNEDLVARLHARGYRVVPTERGRRIDADADEEIAAIERGYEGRLGADGVDALRQSLERLLES